MGWDNEAGNLLWSTPLNWANNIVPDNSASNMFFVAINEAIAPANVFVDFDVTISSLRILAGAAVHLASEFPAGDLYVAAPGVTSSCKAMRTGRASAHCWWKMVA